MRHTSKRTRPGRNRRIFERLERRLLLAGDVLISELMAVNDDTLGLDVIAGIGSGGQFLTHDHTLEHYRDEMYHDWLLDCSAWEAAQDGPDQLVARAAARVRDLVATEAEPPLSRDQEDAVDEIVAQARSDL